MTHKLIHRILTSAIAAVWLINGLVCKVLNVVPRHREIVAEILGREYAKTITVFIGLSEIGMSIWIFSGIWSRVNAITQILIVMAMNLLEFFLVPDLLLWGEANAIFAALFIIVIYFNEFHLNGRADGLTSRTS